MKWLSSALLFAFPALLLAHPEPTNYPKNYFQTPIDAPLLLAGNFGELRPNHFHAGIDITTQGKEGIAVFAAAEGYVSRIRISPFGYGKALYVTHPNGYTTVYGHLRNFNKDIGMYAERNQYEVELFEIDITVAPGALPVKKGEIIARSGNTGGSGGPHLHFEIRDTKTEDAINPLLFGLPVVDKVAPTIVRVAIIPLDINSYVNGKSQKKYITLKLLKGVYVPATAADSMPTVSGRIGFAVDAYDKESTPHGKNGVYGIRLSINGNDVYAHRLERIPFEHSRYINCFIHYETYINSGTYLQCSYLPQNNLLPVYDTVVNSGSFQPQPLKTYKINYILTDAYGNKATAVFRVKGEKETGRGIIFTPPMIDIIPWDSGAVFESTGEWQLEFLPRSVYSFTELITAFENKNPASPKITICNRNIALHKPCTLSMAVKNTENMLAKAVICEQVITKQKTVRFSALSTTMQNGYAVATVKNFGTYQVKYDTTAPVIRTSNFDLKGQKQNNLSTLKALQFTITDNLSGIKTYRATLNGKWVIADYDAKNNRLTIDLAKHTGTGKCALRLEVADKCGNQSIYLKEFTL
ncbi:MAG: M23 family metallopeptidase [Bacteroidota bacterium]|jgi:hypothetical protein